MTENIFLLLIFIMALCAVFGIGGAVCDYLERREKRRGK